MSVPVVVVRDRIIAMFSRYPSLENALCILLLSLFFMERT